MKNNLKKKTQQFLKIFFEHKNKYIQYIMTF